MKLSDLLDRLIIDRSNIVRVHKKNCDILTFNDNQLLNDDYCVIGDRIVNYVIFTFNGIDIICE